MSVQRVLIVGGGSVGLAAAVFLTRHGVTPLVLEQQPGPSVHPRATGLGPRTMEFLRQAGLERAVHDVAVEMPAGGAVKMSAHTLIDTDTRAPAASAVVGNVWGPGDLGPARVRGVCPQHRLDSVLLPAAREGGAQVRYSACVRGCAVDAGGARVTLDTGEQITADYLIAADGARSTIRAQLGIGVGGPGALGEPTASILFRADLTAHLGGRAFVNCTITNPDAPGLLVTVDGKQEWIFHTPAADGARTMTGLTPQRCRELIRTAVGDPALTAEILSVLPWRPRGQLADRFARRRAFLVGDAAHTVPPIGAFGLNTGIADAHNLAWKLAAVLRGDAGPALLDTYAAERRPVAETTLRQALIRLADPTLHWDPDATDRRVAAGAWHAPVVHMGYRYDSAAVIGPEPELPSTQDVLADLDGTPGSRLPHRWLPGGASTLDLIGSHVTVIAGTHRWVAAAGDVADRLGVRLDAHVIPLSGNDMRSWAESVGIQPDGALLIRPDHIVAARTPTAPPAPAHHLHRLLTRILAR